jgi:hypothetical protein
MDDTEEHDEGSQPLAEIASDSDIMSLAGIRQRREIEDWIEETKEPTELSLDQDCNLELWGRLDCKNGVFRPACLIESVFQCLYITKDNVEELYTSVPKPFSARALAKEADSALQEDYALISEHVLSRMEEIWTNKARPQRSQGISKNNLFATIAYHTSISDNWEVKRYLTCLAFDEDALRLFRQYSGRKNKRIIALTKARRLGERNAEDLLKDLQSRSIQYNLAAALSEKRQCLRPVAGTSSSNLCPSFEFFDKACWESSSVSNIFSKVYDWRKIGPGEPTDSYIRFSRQQKSITKFLGEPPVSSYFPGSMPVKYEDFILVALAMVDDHSVKHRLCLYSSMVWGEPPSKPELERALRKVCENDVFYVTGCNNHNDTGFVCQKLKTTKIGNIRNIAREWKHEMQSLLAPASPIKARSPNRHTNKRTSKAAKFDTSKPLAQSSSIIETSKDFNSESTTRYPPQISSKRSTPEPRKDESAELAVTVTEAVQNLYRELASHDVSLSLPTIPNIQIRPAPELAQKPEDRLSHFSHKEDVWNPKIEGFKTGLLTDNNKNSPPLNNSRSSLLLTSASPPTPPPSATGSLPGTPQTRAITPAPSPLSESEAACSSTKRLLEIEDELEIPESRKRHKAYHVPDDKVIIIID